jgi:hypothetical protein
LRLTRPNKLLLLLLLVVVVAVPLLLPCQVCNWAAVAPAVDARLVTRHVKHTKGAVSTAVSQQPCSMHTRIIERYYMQDELHV